jgi:tRNA U34 5-methylaminomethyl-2-thiouridine-forming methyltransferase MnmC
MQRTIITTGDGSKTIHLPDWNENYHSSHGAVQEAKHVFLKHGLDLFLGKSEIHILEIGFGTGLNSILTLEAALQSDTHIYYDGLEAFPITKEEMVALEYENLLTTDFLKNQYKEIHATPWDIPQTITTTFTLTKIHETLQNQYFIPNTYDLIYFDAFGPRVQETMWTPEIFQKLYDSLKTGGYLVTYCAKGQVKRDLKSVGFNVETLPGPPGKREMTRGRK